MLVSWYDEETKKKQTKGKRNERKKKKGKNAQLMGNERQSSHPITEQRKRIRYQVSIYHSNRLIIPLS